VCAPTDVAGLVLANLSDWERLLGLGVIRPGRPDDHTWSSLEYVCHVRDVYRRYDGRLALMLEASDPLFPNWDQDVTAVEDRYGPLPPSVLNLADYGRIRVMAARLGIESIDR